MAIYHLSVKTISRSAGRSATAAIAYRSGELIADQRTGVIHDYTRKQGVEHKEIFLPENAPVWASDRAQLWNAAELSETRKNSTVAREFEVALPAELNQSQRIELVREFARELVDRHGMAVDVAIHEPGKDGDSRNHHAHVLCTTRRLTPEGFKDKTRELDTKTSGEVEQWRGKWAEMSNRHLEKAGREERIDHRSLEAQKEAAIERGEHKQAIQLERLPMKHLGPKVVRLEQRGTRTDRGEVNREIGKANVQIINLADERYKRAIARVQEQMDKGEKSTLADTPLRPEKVKFYWQEEKAIQFDAIALRARLATGRVEAQRERQEKKLHGHVKAMPQEPSGLLARFKQGDYKQKLDTWQTIRNGLEKRFKQLSQRIYQLSQYMRKAGTYEMPTKGEVLAEKKATAARPDLAAAYQKVIEQEKATRAAEMKAKLAQGTRGRNMAEKDIEQAKAQLKEMSPEHKVDLNATNLDQSRTLANHLNGVDKNEARRQKLMEQIKAKLEKDREESRGRGR
ncbi:MobQ family relaxase (plasmid) [Pseudomonas luteola]